MYAEMTTSVGINALNDQDVANDILGDRIINTASIHDEENLVSIELLAVNGDGVGGKAAVIIPPGLLDRLLATLLYTKLHTL